LLLGETVFRATLEAVVDRQHADGADAAVLVEEVPMEVASRCGVCERRPSPKSNGNPSELGYSPRLSLIAELISAIAFVRHGSDILPYALLGIDPIVLPVLVGVTFCSGAQVYYRGGP